MPKTVAIGIQNFEDYITKNCFYIDKTKFIGQWWRSNDNTTVIMRPRRFGKTLTMDMVKTFFSLEYKEKGEAIFGNLEIWQDEEMRALQGTYPVIFITFAGIKPTSYDDMKNSMKALFSQIYMNFYYLLDSTRLSEANKKVFSKVADGLEDNNLKLAMNNLSQFLVQHYGRKVLIILDEYDTPMIEAYTKGFWHEAVEFLRSFFNSTFKTNPYMERALMTGITRISKESIFSDFNHVKLITMFSDDYADCFGFTEEEVFASMEEYGLMEKENVRLWYDGFTIGSKTDIYNPWSIINYLKNKGKLEAYWANSSGNGLINKLLQTGTADIKLKMDMLLRDEPIEVLLDDEIVFSNIDNDEAAMWSMFYASGYLTGSCIRPEAEDQEQPLFSLYITNLETKNMFRKMIKGWFSSVNSSYNDFLKALLKGDIKYMNHYMNKIALATFSYFDTGKHPSEYAEPERFYHGFVLGLIIELRNEYTITSNRESGFGRYDVMMEPKDIEKHDAIIIEFKVYDSDDENDLKETVEAALKQINDMNYEVSLVGKGIPAEKIRKYGFAFEGKKVLIGYMMK